MQTSGKIFGVEWVGRWAFNILAGVSLVLCVATGALGVRSFYKYDCYNVTGYNDYGGDVSWADLASYRGRIVWDATGTTAPARLSFRRRRSS